MVRPVEHGDYLGCGHGAAHHNDTGRTISQDSSDAGHVAEPRGHSAEAGPAVHTAHGEPDLRHGLLSHLTTS